MLGYSFLFAHCTWKEPKSLTHALAFSQKFCNPSDDRPLLFALDCRYDCQRLGFLRYRYNIRTKLQSGVLIQKGDSHSHLNAKKKGLQGIRRSDNMRLKATFRTAVDQPAVAPGDSSSDITTKFSFFRSCREKSFLFASG